MPVKVGQSIPEFRQDLKAAMEPYVNSATGRGVVASAYEQLGGIKAPQVVAPAASDSSFSVAAVGSFMSLWLRATSWQRKLLKHYKHADSFTESHRSMWWAMYDTISIYLLAHYVRGLEDNPVASLRSVVDAPVCFNDWEVLNAIFGVSSVPLNTSALQAAMMHNAARKRQAWLPQYPVGGVTGSARGALDSLAVSLGVLAPKGSNPPKIHFFILLLYVEHCCGTVDAAWQALTTVSTQPLATRSQLTLEILTKHFFLHGLCLSHVARYLQLVSVQLSASSTDDFVGERAGFGISDML